LSPDCRANGSFTAGTMAEGAVRNGVTNTIYQPQLQSWEVFVAEPRLCGWDVGFTQL